MNNSLELQLQSLLEALKVSPDNIPLKTLIAETYSKLEKWSDAESQYMEVLKLAPASNELKFGLANAYYHLGKYSTAFVIVEEILQDLPQNAKSNLLYAKLFLITKEFEKAIAHYNIAIGADSSLKDLEFEKLLNESLSEKSKDEQLNYKAAVEYDVDDLIAEIEKPKINFSDVGGMDKVKEEIQLKIIHPLKFPELYKAYGKTAGGGILLYGPPGCGKTHLARATAGEVNAGFISVGINDILDMWIGNSEKNLHNIFQLARAQSPCVLFFDEVDALGASRNDMKKSGSRHLINQFLSELDGAQYSNDGVLILAATNTPWNMDSAFRRPGRFDRIIFIPPPDEAARASVFEIQLQGKPVSSLDYKTLGKKTSGFSGADIKSVVDIAIESKLIESMKKGVPLPIEQKDLLNAISKVNCSTKEWFSTAKNYALYANESGLYNDILNYLNIKL